MNNATIEDVAHLAGVSPKTVSRVVNNEPNVRPVTRSRVEAAIKQLNYRPNTSARSLASKRSYLIGLLYDNPSANYVTSVQSGVLAVCRENSFDLVIHPCHYQSDNLNEEVINLARQSRVDGLILTPPLSDMAGLTATLGEQAIPYVRMAPLEHNPLSPCIYCDDNEASYQMARHLIELGHRRIGFIAGHPDHGGSAERQAGFDKALAEQGIRQPKELFAQGYFDFASGRACGQQLLSLSQPPTAIFCCNDDMACGVLHIAHEMGLDVPRQLSVTGFDDSPIAEQVWPSLSTVRQPVEKMARRATQLLLSGVRNSGQVAPTEQAILKCQLVLRDTTAAPAED